MATNNEKIEKCCKYFESLPAEKKAKAVREMFSELILAESVSFSNDDEGGGDAYWTSCGEAVGGD